MNEEQLYQIFQIKPGKPQPVYIDPNDPKGIKAIQKCFEKTAKVNLLTKNDRIRVKEIETMTAKGICGTCGQGCHLTKHYGWQHDKPNKDLDKEHFALTEDNLNKVAKLSGHKPNSPDR